MSPRPRRRYTATSGDAMMRPEVETWARRAADPRWLDFSNAEMALACAYIRALEAARDEAVNLYPHLEAIFNTALARQGSRA